MVLLCFIMRAVLFCFFKLLLSFWGMRSYKNSRFDSKTLHTQVIASFFSQNMHRREFFEALDLVPPSHAPLQSVAPVELLHASIQGIAGCKYDHSVGLVEVESRLGGGQFASSRRAHRRDAHTASPGKTYSV